MAGGLGGLDHGLADLQHTPDGADPVVVSGDGASCFFGYVNETSECSVGTTCSRLVCRNATSGRYENVCDSVMDDGPSKAMVDAATGLVLFVDDNSYTMKSINVSTRACEIATVAKLPQPKNW